MIIKLINQSWILIIIGRQKHLKEQLIKNAVLYENVEDGWKDDE